MSKLTVESIIRIYGSKVKEVKVFNEKKRAQAENFLQIEPVAFALADEQDVLRIYVDKESAEASLDGTLQDSEQGTEEAQEAFDNLPEGLQCSERGEAMEEAISNLEEAYDGMDDIISSVEAAGE